MRVCGWHLSSACPCVEAENAAMVSDERTTAAKAKLASMSDEQVMALWAKLQAMHGEERGKQ